MVFEWTAKGEEALKALSDVNVLRECTVGCAHFDSINLCCWQASEKGLCIDVAEGDVCHWGYLETQEEILNK